MFGTVADNSHFKAFAIHLDAAIQAQGDMPDDQDEFIVRQKQQVETLDNLETEFRLALIAHPYGNNVFKEFVSYIRDVRRNILDARPYYRERQEKFTAEISVALHSRGDISPFHFNHRFVLFALAAKKWKYNSKVRIIARKLEAARTELIELNTPLAIARATRFYKKTPKSHLTRMDLIQTAMEGLVSGIDKYSGPYDNELYRQVLIGRILGNCISSYSETMIHFFPSDKRKLYNANKAIRHFSIDNHVDYEGLSKHINENAKQHQYRTSGDEIAGLLCAASTVSADSSSITHVDGEVITDLFERCADDEAHRPDVQVETEQVHRVLVGALQGLSVIEKKVLRLKGIGLG